MSCEQCWTDAYVIARMRGIPQVEAYYELLEKRADNPCDQPGVDGEGDQ